MTAKQIAIRWILATLVFLLCLALIILLYNGCGCPRIARPNSVPEYPVDHSACSFTPMGACIIINNNIVSDNFYLIVDDKINETELCLKEWYATQDDVLHRVYNWKPPARSCYTILLPDDIRQSCEDPEQQVFGKIPFEACAAKGFIPKEGCECGLRVAIQDGSVILTTSDLTLFRNGVIELLTGMRQVDIWNDDEVLKCAGW